jgi:lipid-A-disaccharide synthase
MKFFFIVGEDSGDAIAANLISSLKEKYGDSAECMGIGGPMMAAAGFNQLLPMDQITVFGIWEVIPKLFQLIRINNAVVEEIEKRQPDVVITVDFPDFNFIAAKALKKRGIFKGKLVHYVAPSVWAWREGRAKKIAQFMDGMMCLFPMEVEYFTKHGMKAAYVGHPLVENFEDTAGDTSFREANAIPDKAITLGLFFGSRESEFKNMHKVLLKSAEYVLDNVKNVHIIVPTLPKNEYDVQAFLDDIKTPVYVSSNPKYKWNAFQSCDVAIAVSGTVALELAYANVPHVIAYKLNPITYLILSLMVKVKNAHLVNILLKKTVVPEFIQGNCEPEKIAQAVIELIMHKDKCQEMQAGFAEMRNVLKTQNDKTPSECAADFVVSMIPKKSA